MKKLIQLSALATVLSVLVIACDPPKSSSEQKPDSVTTSTSTKIVDTIKRDTSGKVILSKKDSTVVTKSEKKTSGQ